MNDFYGKVAVITGSASGLGRAFADTAAGLGMKLVLADVQAKALEQAAEELLAQGAEVLAMVCDVSKGSHVQELADSAMARFGGVHLVFNNAGVGTGGLVWENSPEDWEWVLGVNLWGAIHGVRVFTRVMLECAARDPRYEGHIVNSASMAGLLVPPAMGVYNVSKHAVVALTETLYHDLQLVEAPIATSVLCPYFVPTEIARSERNRPDDLARQGRVTPSQAASQRLSEQAVESGSVTAADVARKTFEAIREKHFYIYSHPHELEAVAQRFDAIVHGRPPADPYAAMPQVTQTLKARIRRRP
jgi:NAD(P)-dependent dehydrogenase (short-subunit alcohol dehydrogenase family)